MSNFNIVLHNGKYRLHFQGFAYCYSNPIGIVGSHWGCIVAACPAHVKINKTKDTIIGGDFTHNHESSDTTTTKPSSPRSPKTTSSFSTPPKTKPISKKSDLQNGTPFSTPKGPSKSSEDAVDSNDILNISYKEQRDAAIDTIMTKENELETVKKELSESKDLIESLKASISAIEAGWEVDRAELKELRSELSKFRSESKIKLTVIGDSHVKFLEDGLSKLFPAYFDIKCLAKSGATMEDVSSRDSRSHTTHDTVIIFAGTNDVCKTSWKSFVQSLDEIFSKYQTCKLGFILVPPMRGIYETNKHITSLNERIINHSKNKNVFLLNPQLVLKNNNFNKDGLHFNEIGRNEICSMIKSSVLLNQKLDTMVTSNELGKSERFQMSRNGDKVCFVTNTKRQVSNANNRETHETGRKSNLHSNTNRNNSNSIRNNTAQHHVNQKQNSYHYNKHYHNQHSYHRHNSTGYTRNFRHFKPVVTFSHRNHYGRESGRYYPHYDSPYRQNHFRRRYSYENQGDIYDSYCYQRRNFQPYNTRGFKNHVFYPTDGTNVNSFF